MAVLENKIDFALVFTARNANPNGDPLDGNRPRTTYKGLGEVSDVCLKRKIRNRLLDAGQNIFVQSDDRRREGDMFRSLKDRADNEPALVECTKQIKAGKKTREDYARQACEIWYDVRAFGQVFAFKKGKKEEDESDAVSIGIRGPVSIQPAFSIEPVNITSSQITKSVNLETGKDPDKKGSDTMGMKHRVDFGVYVTYGAINVQLAGKTGFSEEDAEALKEALRTLFCNDETSARPAGSMEVMKLIWWKHNCASGQYSSAKVHRTLQISCDDLGSVSISTKNLEGLIPEVLDGE
ncbi:type I-C CRISPR-associated protein Cas7/Csd2 [Lactonifactor longoviformis]|uniref:CRISPR-associated protein, Csd2 family n=1 Tax=Lactonifactor longoviformis DSM 17459 TaxID=1122155 RepID=A0A1M4ZAB1_9CLOT|nr:type I-C CRISPR-associated protein Cas7/Csd2 [Lactonifactor longoviformis]POP31534.1 type I-C CRISPR-associated protein Cas7/Csd2 [Lactonifactor longoviformis]SHF14944.1 CRISPR-associated protein, Csd2 family [Lactonifactor longoviformis DSM 17459]